MLIETGRVVETVQLASSENSGLLYALVMEPGSEPMHLRREASGISIVVASARAIEWAESASQVGMYASIDLGGNGTLELLVEKDFACLDLSDAENQDTFPNPQLGSVC